MKWLLAIVMVVVFAGCGGEQPQWFPDNGGGGSTPTFSGDFIPATDAPLGQAVQSNQVTLTGTAASWTVSVSGGITPEYSINNGAYTSSPGVISPNQSLSLRQVASTNPNQISTMTVTVNGNVTRSWSVTSALQ